MSYVCFMDMCIFLCVCLFMFYIYSFYGRIVTKYARLCLIDSRTGDYVSNVLTVQPSVDEQGIYNI